MKEGQRIPVAQVRRAVTPPLTTTSVSQSYAMTTADRVVRVDATSAACTITLPKASNVVGESLVIRKADTSSHAVTIATQSPDTIGVVGIPALALTRADQSVTLRAYRNGNTVAYELTGGVDPTEVYVTNLGARGDGITDDAAAIQAVNDALAANGGGRMIVPGGATCVVNSAINWSDTVNITIDGTVKAGAAMTAVFQTPLSSVVRYVTMNGTGRIDCNDLATSGVHPRYFGHVVVQDVTIERPALYGLRFGDTGAPGTSFEGMVQNVHVLRRSTHSAIPAGSIGIYHDNCSDSTVNGAVIVGSETGTKTNSGQTRYIDVYAWAYAATGAMLVGYDDNGQGTEFIGCTADTPSTYGFRLRQQDARITGGKVYVNNLYGVDNTVIGVKLDNETSSRATIIGMEFRGADASHRLAADINIHDLGSLSSGASYDNCTYLPGFRTNVVLRQDHRVPQAFSVNGAFNAGYTRIGTTTFWRDATGAVRVKGSNTASTATDGRLLTAGDADVIAVSGSRTALATDQCASLRVTTGASTATQSVATTLATGWKATFTKVDSGVGAMTISGTSCTFNSVGATGAASLSTSTQWKGYTIVHVGSGVFDVIAAT